MVTSWATFQMTFYAGIFIGSHRGNLVTSHTPSTTKKADTLLKSVSLDVYLSGDEVFRASLMPSAGQIFSRSDRALYCIGRKSALGEK